MQMRVSEIMRASINYQELDQEQVMMVLNKVEEVISSNAYQGDVEYNTYLCLYELANTAELWILERLVCHPVFDKILMCCYFKQNRIRHRFVWILCLIFKRADS